LEPFDNSWIDRPIFARFELIADLMPDKIALDDGVFRFTYREVQQAARHLAVRVEATVPMGRPVGIFLPNGALFPIAALACLATGRLFVPIDQSYPPERNDQIIKEAGLAAVILGRTDEIANSPFASIHQLDLTIRWTKQKAKGSSRLVKSMARPSSSTHLAARAVLKAFAMIKGLSRNEWPNSPRHAV
jgi:acyl-CoA synthetase (AMP-forming)/AMP-acid ligase II